MRELAPCLEYLAKKTQLQTWNTAATLNLLTQLGENLYTSPLLISFIIGTDSMVRITLLIICCPFPCRNVLLQSLPEINLLIMDDQITLAAPHDVAEGANHGGDNHPPLLATVGDGAVIDDVLEILSVPARHHILPDCYGGGFH